MSVINSKGEACVQRQNREPGLATPGQVHIYLQDGEAAEGDVHIRMGRKRGGFGIPQVNAMGVLFVCLMCCMYASVGEIKVRNKRTKLLGFRLNRAKQQVHSATWNSMRR
jgi:hypothetical protein